MSSPEGVSSSSGPVVESPLSRKVLHLGEVAGVAATLVGGLRSIGVDCEYRELPVPAADSSPLVKILRIRPRITSARGLRRELKDSNAIAHVHYATSGLWFLGIRPLVIHCHGDDVRDPALAQRVVVDRILSSADLVIGATPDLLRWLPQGARYLPNPVDISLYDISTPVEDAPKDVFVFSVLAEWKGATEILELVRELRARRPSLRISAINHGQYADEFRAVGVEMAEFMSPDELAGFINEHKVVVGQRLLGVAGTSELQALACGRPVAMPLSSEVDPAHQPPTLSQADPVQAAEEILDLLDDPKSLGAMGERSREWVMQTHGVEAVSRTLTQWYKELNS